MANIEQVPRQAVRIPLAQYTGTRDTPADLATRAFIDSQLSNAYVEVEVNRVTGEKQLWVRKRPGVATQVTANGLAISRGMYWWDIANKLVVCAGTQVWFIDVSTNAVAAVPTLTLQAGSGSVRFVEVPATTVGGSQLMLLEPSNIGGFNKLYRIAPAGTLIATTTIPTNSIGYPVWFDEYLFYYGIDGKIYNSSLNDPSTWSSSSFFNPDSWPDGPVTIERTINYIVAFKDYSIDLLYDASNPTLTPLAKNPSATINLGCVGKETVRRTGSTIFFLGQNLNGFQGVFSLNNVGAIEKISTPEIDRKLQATLKSRSLSGSYSSNPLTSVIFAIDGNVFYYIPDTNDIYNITTKMWSVWSFVSGLLSEACFINFSASSFTFNSKNGATYVLQPNGRIAELSSYFYQDTNAAGSPAVIQVQVQTPRWDMGFNRRKFIRAVELIGDFTGATVGINWYDDDYTNLNSVSNRNVVMQSPRAFLTRCGATRRRAWFIQHLENLPLRLQALEVEFDVGKT